MSSLKTLDRLRLLSDGTLRTTLVAGSQVWRLDMTWKDDPSLPPDPRNGKAQRRPQVFIGCQGPFWLTDITPSLIATLIAKNYRGRAKKRAWADSVRSLREVSEVTGLYSPDWAHEPIYTYAPRSLKPAKRAKKAKKRSRR